MRPLVTLPLALATILAGFSFRVSAAESSLPDTVLARVGTRLITRSEFLRQWQRLASGADAGGTLAARERAFLDQMVAKELLTLATADMGFVPGPEESAKLALVRLNQMRQAYYRIMVLDSLPPEDPHPGHLRVHSGTSPELDRAALASAAEARLVARLIAPVRASWDDSTAALLARAFSKLPKPREEGPGWLRWNYTAWMPPVAASDTARLLGHSDLGPFSVGRFLWHWSQLPPAQRDRPDSSAGVLQWAENFLAQGLLDQEARRMQLDALPEVEAEVAKQRQLMALDAYYQKHVSSAVDTSEKRLRAVWQKNPHGFDGQPYARYEGLWYRRFDDAAAGARALEHGANWDTLLAARYPLPADPEDARLVTSEADLYRNPQVLLPTSPDTTLAQWFARARRGQVFGPRDRAGQWWIYRFLEARDGKRRSFDEARPFVAEQTAFDDEENGLREHLAELRRHYDVLVNEAALLALAAAGEPK